MAAKPVKNLSRFEKHFSGYCKNNMAGIKFDIKYKMLQFCGNECGSKAKELKKM